MAADVSLAKASGLPVLSWRVEDGELVLRFDAAKDGRILRCNCGRRHWIVETRHRGGRAILAVKCHGCGTTQDLLLAAPPLLPR